MLLPPRQPQPISSAARYGRGEGAACGKHHHAEEHAAHWPTARRQRRGEGHDRGAQGLAAKAIFTNHGSATRPTGKGSSVWSRGLYCVKIRFDSFWFDTLSRAAVSGLSNGLHAVTCIYAIHAIVVLYMCTNHTHPGTRIRTAASASERASSGPESPCDARARSAPP